MKRGWKDYLIKTNTHTHKITKLKQESREKRNAQQLSIESEPSEPHNFAILSKSVDSKDRDHSKTDEKVTQNTIPTTHIVKASTFDVQERSTKDSPYVSSYASKGKRKKSKEQSSKESLRKPARKKINRGEQKLIL